MALFRHRQAKPDHLNAVIYEVDPAELLATDKRELSYCGATVAIPDIKPLESDFFPAPKGQTSIYVNRPESVATPDSRYPIVQSYVDVFVSGCLEQEQRFSLAGFAKQCLSTTAGWSEHWVNDRIHPPASFHFSAESKANRQLAVQTAATIFLSDQVRAGRLMNPVANRAEIILRAGFALSRACSIGLMG